MKGNGKKFGTDGFRGEANKNLTAHHAYKIGRFLDEYSCVMKSHFRKFGNQSSGTRKSSILCLMTYPFLLGYLSRPCRICGA